MLRNNTTAPPYHEPLRATLLRNAAIALVLGAVLTRSFGGWASFPIAALIAFWPSFGGHWIEILFLNFIRPRIPSGRILQASVRISLWFIGGTALGYGMRLTAMLLARSRPTRWPTWWIAGLGFIGVELIAHLALQLRGQRSFYNGSG